MGPEDAPHRIGRYEIRRELGRGMMGVVYEAWDPALGRRVALKTVKAVAPSRPEREAWEQRFLSEARAAARLSHPCIVVVHDVGRDPDSDVLFMALEYLQGETLAEKIGEGRALPWREALRIVGRVADALHHAHGQGVVHRDVKPANVMIVASGEPKILDFGIARLDAGSLTLPGDLFGTPLYMSPEQAAGETVDARSDLFSLGTITWALLTGRTPFEASSVPAILSRVMLRDPPPPSEVVPGIPADVDRIVARATAKVPEERYPDGRSLAEDIEDVLAGRAPRHLVDWTPARTGERTISSQRLRSDLVLAELDERRKEAEAAPTAPPRSRRGGWRVRALLMLVLLASAFGFLYLHPEHVTILDALVRQARSSRVAAAAARLMAAARARAPEASPAPAAAAPSLAPSPAIGAAPTPSPGADVAALPSPGEAGGASPAAPSAAPATPVPEAPQKPVPAEAALASPSPTPSAAPSSLSAEPATKATPTPAPSAMPTPAAVSTPPPKPQSKPRATASLSIGLEHHLKSGTLEVWIDGTQLVREPLDGRVTRKVLVLDAGRGSRTLALEPGRHHLRVRIRSSGWTKAGETSAVLQSGTTRRLEIKSLRLSGKLSLVWR